MSGPVWALAIHGGASPAHKEDYTTDLAFMRDVLEAGREALQAGATALDVVNAAVRALEDCGHHIAGRGASPNKDGKWELDAAIMDGPSRKAGAVGALRGFKSPIDCARVVLQHSPHIFIVGKGASKFLAPHKLERITSPGRYYQPVVPTAVEGGALQHGTVGAVALDTMGQLASATSTGGLLNKQPGRIGDSPIIGAGTWADERVAVSCTGQGEFFMRVNAAADVSARIRYAQQRLSEATAQVMDDLRYLGGQGGLIAIDRLGRVAAPFNTAVHKRGWVTHREDVHVAAFMG